jgi:hypothetical protein
MTMAQGKPRHASGAPATADRVSRLRRGPLAAIAGLLIVAGLGAWMVRRGHAAAADAQPARLRAPERSASQSAQSGEQPAALALAGAGGPGESPAASDDAARAPGTLRPGSRRWWRAARWLPAIVGALAALALGGWIFVEHGDVLVMQTPSMGTTAPAGSLVLTRPIGAVALRRGMIVAFHVPTTGQVYMHRVAQLLPGGRFRTRGDLNSSDDGWELTRSSIIGVPLVIVPDLGWLVSGLPWALAVLAAGTVVGLVLPRFLRPAMRSVTVGGAVALPLSLIRPFVRVAVASAGRVPAVAHAAAARGSHHGGVTTASSSHSGVNFLARLVNGGVLPLRVSMPGTHTVIEPGHAGIIAAHLRGHAVSALQAHPILPTWAWVALVSLMISPLGFGLLALRDGTARAAPLAVRSRLRISPKNMLNVGRRAADIGG